MATGEPESSRVASTTPNDGEPSRRAATESELARSELALRDAQVVDLAARLADALVSVEEERTRRQELERAIGGFERSRVWRLREFARRIKGGVSRRLHRPTSRKRRSGDT